MKDNASLWLLLRVIVLAGASWEVFSFSSYPSNVDWVGCALVSVFVGAALFGWLVMLGRLRSVDWSAPLSATKPFFPIHRYPVQFWSLAACPFLIGGGAALVLAMVKRAPAAPAATLFFMGIAMAAAVAVACRLSSGSRSTL
jgi:hypothetical protein